MLFRLPSAVIGLGVLAIAGCGQTGALRLPQEAPARESYLIGSNPNAAPKRAPAAVETPAEQPDEPASVVPEPAP